MSDVFHLHQICGDAIEFTREGRTVKLAPLTMRGRGNLGIKFLTIAKSPLERLKAVKPEMSEESYKAAFEVALKQQQYWPPAIDSAEALTFMAGNMEMQQAILAEMLRKHQPDNAEGLAEWLMDVLTPVEYAEIGAFGWTARRATEPDFTTPPAMTTET